MKEDVEQREPETEEDYWEIIEGLGGLGWRMNHDLADGRPWTAGTEGSVTSIHSQLESIVLVACLKFGIIHPHQPELTPEGTREYWEWYGGTKAKIFGNEYDRSVCSSCAMSEGKERYDGGGVPCKLVNGFMRMHIDVATTECPHVHHNQRCARDGRTDEPSSQEALLQMILDRHGEEAWIRMKARLGMEDLEQTRREATVVVSRDHPSWTTVPERTCVIDVSGGSSKDVFEREGEMCFLRVPRDVISVLFDRMVRYYSARTHDRKTFPNDDCVVAFSVYDLNDGESIMVTFDVPFDQAAWEAYHEARERGDSIEPFIDARFWPNGMFGRSDVYEFLRFVDRDQGDDQDLVEESRAIGREGIHIDEYFFTEEIVSTLLGKD